MDRPKLLHIKISASDSQFQSARTLLVCTLAAPRMDGIKCYDSTDSELFAALVTRCENGSEKASCLVVGEFGEDNFKAYDNITRYLESFTVTSMCTNPNCKEDHSKPRPPPKNPTQEEYAQYHVAHGEGCKRIVENYISHINTCIVTSGLVSIYNRAQKISPMEEVPMLMRREIYHYVRLMYYKASVIPPRNSEDMVKIASIMATFEEADMDDSRSLMSPSHASSLSKFQRKTRDKDFVMHCLAFFAGIKFDQYEDIDDLHGRSSMYV